MLDTSLEAMEYGTEGGAAAPARQPLPVFVPPVITPAVERMLQVSTVMASKHAHGMLASSCW